MAVVIGKVLSATSQKMERGRIAAWFGDIVGGDCDHDSGSGWSQNVNLDKRNLSGWLATSEVTC